jgi:glutamate-1-semialdehyde 2,1-aminomutase
LTHVARYNDLASVEAVLADHADDVAAIIVEPVGANMGVVPPATGFLEGLRAICDRIGAVLIFDEVITGFRVAWGGAQELFGVRADLATYGKIIGGGLPVGAYGGRADLMDLVAPAGSVYQAGTLSGNPLAMAAGIAQLTALRDRNAYETLHANGSAFSTTLRAAVERTGARAAVAQVGSLVTLFHLSDDMTSPPSNFDEARTLDTAAFARTHATALNAGHMLPASQFEALFVSTTHTNDDFESLAASIEQALERWRLAAE